MPPPPHASPRKPAEASTTRHADRFHLIHFSPPRFTFLPPIQTHPKPRQEAAAEESPKPPRKFPSMEKKDLLGVRMKSPGTKRRRRVSAGAGSGGRGLAKAIAEYLASDSYMYAPLLSDPQQPPPPPPPPTTTKKPAEAPATVSHEKEVTVESLVQKYRGSW